MNPGEKPDTFVQRFRTALDRCVASSLVAGACAQCFPFLCNLRAVKAEVPNAATLREDMAWVFENFKDGPVLAPIGRAMREDWRKQYEWHRLMFGVGVSK